MLLHHDRVVREPLARELDVEPLVSSYAATVTRRVPFSITLSMLMAFVGGLALYAIGGKELARIGLLAGAILGGTLPRPRSRSQAE